MALDSTSCDGELSEVLCTGRAAEHCPNTNASDDLCDKIFTAFLKNVSDCKYSDLSELNQTKFNFSKPDSLILVHINIDL